MRKFTTIILILCITLVFSTWQYRILCALCILTVWRTEISKKAFKNFIIVLAILFVVASPDYIPKGRYRTYYDVERKNVSFWKSASAIIPDVIRDYFYLLVDESTPNFIYFLDVLFPEEEIMNFGLKATAVLPTKYISLFGHKLDEDLIKAIRKDFWSPVFPKFYSPYRRWGNNSSVSTVQAWNEITGDNISAFCVTFPKDFKKGMVYPIVIVAHGYLGLEGFYQGLMDKLENCFVFHVGSRDLNGKYSLADINKIYIFCEQFIDLKQNSSEPFRNLPRHFIGIGNGGTAADIVLDNFSDEFSSVSYISSPCHFNGNTDTKVLLIGGGMDADSYSLTHTFEKLKEKGTPTSLFWDKSENHLLVLHKTGDIISFLKRELSL